MSSALEAHLESLQAFRTPLGPGRSTWQYQFSRSALRLDSKQYMCIGSSLEGSTSALDVHLEKAQVPLKLRTKSL